MEKFRFTTMGTSGIKKVEIQCSLEYARQLIDSGYVHSGVWETLTNRIYL